MSNTGIPLQSAQNPQPDEDLLAMLGLHPAQMQVAHGIASGAIHPQQVLDATTPKPPLQAAENPGVAIPGAAPPPIAAPDVAAAPAESRTPPAALAPVAPPPVLSGQAASPRIAPQLNENVTPPTRVTETGAEARRLENSPSGIAGFQQRHPVLGTIARIGAGIGSAMFPTIAAAIPGTDYHHQLLLNQAHANEADALGVEEKQAQIGETGARTAHENAQAEAALNPKDKVGTTPEAETLHDLMTGENGTPRVNPDTGKPYQYLEAFQKVYQAKQDVKPDPREKPDSPEQQFIDEYQTKNPKATIADAQKAFKKNETVSEPGSFMPLYDEKGHVSGAWDPKSGRVVKPPDAAGTTTGGHAIADKANTAATKEAQPYQQMVENATEAHQLADMAAKGNASADVDLVLSFFKMMKGTGGAGVRFTQQEQNLILGARNAGQELVAVGQKVIGEGQPLTPEQRAHMVEVMDMHAKAAQQHLDSMKGGTENKGGAGVEYKPGLVRNGYKFKGGDPTDKANWEQQ